MNIPPFKNQDLFQKVFTHRSFLNESNTNLESNERLEFLGDSVLSLVVSSYIFEKYPNIDEGKLTNIRSALTNTQTLYKISKKLNLGSLLRLSKGEKESGGRDNKTILANTYEALIGGLYIDQGMQAAQSFIHNTLLTNLEKIISSEDLKDPKSNLQEVIQAKQKISPTYQLLGEEGPDHAKTYTVGVYVKEKLLAEGKGHSKQEAEKEAARIALLKTQKQQDGQIPA